LAPVLCLSFKEVWCNLKLFADDVKVYAKIVNTCDVNRLQCALEWSEMWQLPISVNKCCTLHNGKLDIFATPNAATPLLRYNVCMNSYA